MSSKITDIYLRYLDGKASRAELDTLFQYFEEASQEDLEALIELGFNNQPQTVRDLEIDASLNRVHTRLLAYQGSSKPRVMRWRTVGFSIAASILIIFGIFHFLTKPKLQDLKDVNPPTASLLIKDAKGTTYSVTDQKDSVWTTENIIYQLVDSQTLRLSLAKNSVKPVEQTFYTERSDFKFVLEDGSTITLNAHSSLKLPIPFDSKERKVELVGEGYFDIAHDASRPFKVWASNNLIEVLGTQFNIRNYPEDQAVTTSLIKGSIALSEHGGTERIILSPGQKAISDASGINVLGSGTKQATAWTTRYFAYEDGELSTILSDLGRWYNVDIDTQSTPAEKRIYMKINKDKKLSEVLKLLGATSNLSFTLVDGKIHTDTTGLEKY